MSWLILVCFRMQVRRPLSTHSCPSMRKSSICVCMSACVMYLIMCSSPTHTCSHTTTRIVHFNYRQIRFRPPLMRIKEQVISDLTMIYEKLLLLLCMSVRLVFSTYFYLFQCCNKFHKCPIEYSRRQ